MMRRILGLGVVFGVSITSSSAATPADPAIEFGWARTIGGREFEGATAVTATREGNIIIAGQFLGDVDLDPGKKRAFHRPKGENDIFVSGYARSGGFVWAATMGAKSFDAAYALSANPAGDAVIAGSFSERVDFDPNDGKDTRNSNGGHDAFLTLLRHDGTYGWTGTVGGPSTDSARGIAFDSAGNIVLTGTFRDTVDFDPGRGVDRHSSSTGSNIFVSKLTSGGKYRWTRTFGSLTNGGDSGWAIATDANDNIFVTGQFFGTADFDPGPGEDIHQSLGEEDAFITSFSPDGDYRWTHTFGGPARNDWGRGVVTDAGGTVYITGSFADTVNFDRRGAGDVRIAQGQSDAYVTSRAADGSYRWTRTIGGTMGVGATALAYDANLDLLVVAGGFTGTADFDPGPGRDERDALGGPDAFITWLTTDGEYIRTETFGGTGFDVPRGVAVDGESSVVLAGEFNSPLSDFDPTSGVDVHESQGSYDSFVMKLYCGPCESVERHSLTVKKKALIGEVRALVPGGRVTVECTLSDPPGEPIETNVNINGENMGSYKLKKLKKGEYGCAITEVRDADGDFVCNEPAGKRTVTVE